jgi:hypothetical protein
MNTSTKTHAAHEPGRSPSRNPGALIAVIAVPVIFAVTILTFAWPAARLKPRDLPLGLAGPAQATKPIEQRLAQQSGAYDVHRYADEQQARDAIENRDVYGAIVASPSGLKLLTASAASPTFAGMIERSFAEPQIEAALKSAGKPLPQVEDVVPADSDDPRGSVLNSLVLPLVLSSVITAALLTLKGRPGRLEAAALIVAASLGGLVGIAMVQSWLSAFGGPWLVNAGVLCLTMLAIASTLVGLSSLLGHAGLALGGLTMVLVANPWSGISSAPELLPQPIGLIGQLLPPGAGGNLLRSTAYFDGAGSGWHLAVLVGWAAFGFSAIYAGGLLQRRRAEAPQGLEPALPGAG